MNIVYLAPHFPPHYLRFRRRLKQAGASVKGIRNPPYDHLPVKVRVALTEYFRIDGMHNYDALLRACGFFTRKHGKIDRFESLDEGWLNTFEPDDSSVSVQAITKVLNHGAIHYTLGMRGFYFSVPLVLWFFGPLWMLTGSLVLVAV
jgi:hypothetical protein